jgi:hypothetical protein
MADQIITIKCPNPKCQREIPLTDALTEQIEERIKQRYEADAAVKDKKMQARLEEIRQKEKVLEEKRQAIDEQVSDKLKEMQKTIAEQEKEKAKTIVERKIRQFFVEHAEQTKALEEELTEKSKQLSDMRKQEIELRKKERELDEKLQELELENQRKLNEERKKIIQDADKKASEEQKLKLREKDEQLESLKKQLDDLRFKTDPAGPMTGPAGEKELVNTLERIFVYDKFEEVKKGVKGADLVQTVRNTSGKECGKILWEAKNTKDFQKTWIDKLKRDQQRANADIAVIVSVALPNDMHDCFDIYEGVWVTDFKSSTALARALRQILIEATRQKVITGEKETIQDVVYNYITSREFSLHIRAVVNSYQHMQKDLESEKLSMARIWNKREKQISTILDNVTGMYGSIEGLLGNQKALPEIEALSLDAIGDSDIQTE